MNLAVQYLRRSREPLGAYHGFCGELVGSMIHWLGEGRVSILYITGGNSGIQLDDGFRWTHHMVAIVGGRVHDAWFPKYVLPPKQYLEAAFPGQGLRGDVVSIGDAGYVEVAAILSDEKDVRRNFVLLGLGIS